MSASTEFVENGRGVIFHGVGELTGQEVIAVKQKLAADEEGVRLLEFALVLLVGVRTFDITADEVRMVAAIDHRLARLVPHLKVGVVAPRDHDFGMARMWEVIANVPGWTKSVFRDRVEAEAWIHSLLKPPNRV
jgi:hypothetical protein